jgi:hypothetical protein
MCIIIHLPPKQQNNILVEYRIYFSACFKEICGIQCSHCPFFFLRDRFFLASDPFPAASQTHWGSRAALDANPKLLTSLRWLAQDHKNATAVAVLRLCRAIGVFAPTEKYDARTVKTKVVFCAAQLAFTVVCFAPTPLLYYSQRAHLAYLIIVFTTSLYYGASFYIEIFRCTISDESSNRPRAIIRCPPKPELGGCIIVFS